MDFTWDRGRQLSSVKDEGSLNAAYEYNDQGIRTKSGHEDAYQTFFTIKETPVRGRKILYNNEAIQKYRNRYAGFYALLANDIKDPVEALIIYRNKDNIEKCFDDLKNQLDMKRLRIHSSPAMDGRLFIQFIA